jgi:membrane-anchored protein YejM (alkaline phosphatase superfamily)
MPVKYVHILFITLALLLGLGLAAWAWEQHRESGQKFFIIYAAGSALSSCVLCGYVIYFWRRFNRINSK